MVWELVCWIILLFFTLLGIAVSIYLLLFRVITPAGKREYLLLMPSACPGDAVSEIYAAQLRAELLGHKQCGGVLVILNGMDDETTAQCKRPATLAAVFIFAHWKNCSSILARLSRPKKPILNEK